MSTRSNIAIENQDGSITSLYCHFDGYLQHVGKILADNYSDPKMKSFLMGMGLGL